MTRHIPPKYQTMREICEIAGIPVSQPSKGSSIPKTFFSDLLSEMGLPQKSNMPEMARSIIEAAHLSWHEDFSSEYSASGGGSTVTALGLLQVKNAILVWRNFDPLPLPENFDFTEWEPALDWEIIRSGLPKEETLGIARPGSQVFRASVLEAYGFKCAVSGVEVQEAIEVAHIVPYYGTMSDHIQNAIPLRADLHKLFDSGLLMINYVRSRKQYEIQFDNSALSNYAGFEGNLLFVPEEKNFHPSIKALEIKNLIHHRED
jgi:hypothetical protein